MKILIVGAGMYVTGRHGTGEGTILAALAQSSRELPIEKLDIVARKPENEAAVREAAQRINGRLGTSIAPRYLAVPSVARHLEQDSDYDAAIVCVPDHLHCEVGKAVLERKLHCLMVKPFTPTLAEAQELLTLQRARGVHGAVEFHKRFDESNLMVRRLLAEGGIGTARYFVIGYSQRISIPLEVFREWSTRTNIFQYLGVHYVDLVQFLTGARPLRAMALATRGVLSGQGMDTPDSVHATIEWQGGAGGETPFVSVMNLGWIDPRTSSALSDQRFTLVCSRGRLEVDQKKRGIELVRDCGGVQDLNPYFAEYLPGLDGKLTFQGYGYQSIRAFLDDLLAVKAGQLTAAELERSRPSFKEALVSTAVIEAVNLSLESSSNWVAIEGAKA